VTSVIVWDIESVPDLSGFARANRLEGKTDEEIREAIGDKFPKHVYHSIICIGALIASDKGSHWEVEALGAPHVGERTEKELISAFVNKIDELKPQLVTFNGSGFDLPVLRYRAMVNEVSAPGLSARPYFNRYTEDALDLCDVLASFNPQCRASLDELCRLMGFPGKPDGFCGSDVESYFRDGKIREIAAYCESDVVNTYRLWLRHELFRGRIGQSKYEESELRLNAFLDSRNSKVTLSASSGARRMQRIEIPVEDNLLESMSEAFGWLELSWQPVTEPKADETEAAERCHELIVARVDGLSIKIWADEHPPPHFHVSYQTQDASFSILDCARLPGTEGLERYERTIRDWWRKNQPLLIEKWNTSRPSDCPIGAVTLPLGSSGSS
jgi:3'-5' exonuclease